MWNTKISGELSELMGLGAAGHRGGEHTGWLLEKKEEGFESENQEE